VNADTKEKTGRAYFQQLAPLAGFAVDLESIQQRCPPAPAIECLLTDGSPFAAELVALDDESTRARLANMENTKLCWYDAREMWPPEQQVAIDNFSRDLNLVCLFANMAGSRVRKRVFYDVQRLLLDLPENFEGDLLAHLRAADAAHRVEYLQAHRGGTSGIRISAPSGGGWLAPNSEALIAKLIHAPYESAAPVHLFAYSEHDGLDAAVNSLAALEATVRDHLSTMPFVAVHFFDWRGPRHLLAVP